MIDPAATRVPLRNAATGMVRRPWGNTSVMRTAPGPHATTRPAALADNTVPGIVECTVASATDDCRNAIRLPSTMAAARGQGCRPRIWRSMTGAGRAHTIWLS